MRCPCEKVFVLLVLAIVFSVSAENKDDQYSKEILPFLNKYCVECHGGKKVKGHVNFKAIGNMQQAYKNHDLWESVVDVMKEKDMPPEEEKQPDEKEKALFNAWYKKNFVEIEAKPADAKLRRLSTEEYRNSLRSLLGFDLKAAVSDTPETVMEHSLVIKMMPPDPPGESGFGNDTSKAPITATLWEKYNFLTNSAVSNLFSEKYRKYLEAYTGPIKGQLSESQARELISKFTIRAFKTMDCQESIEKSYARLKSDSNRV